MEEKENILTGYCFLAALTENQNDLFNHVFVPICKRALSLYSLKGAIRGKDIDIQNIIMDEYSIDVPIVMVRKLINAVSRSFSRRDKQQTNFNVINNGEAFEIQKYAFNELENKYKKGIRDAKFLQEAFLTYLASEKIDFSNLPSFSDFLDKNKRYIASFFRGNGEIKKEDINKVYIHHIHFLEYIETSNNILFEIAEQLYIGSIVASFLESGFDLEPKFDSTEIYYIDTPLILKALDLQKEEDNQPILELFDLIKKTGGKLKVLSITIDEVFKVIENAISCYNNKIPTTTINEACLRKGKNKAWLISFNANLESHVLNELKMSKEEINKSFRDKYEKYQDVKSLQDERIRKGNALHDVLAYLFVRDKRGGSISVFQKAKIWFLTSNVDLLRFNKEHNPHNGITEIVLPDVLTSLLWLKNPSKFITQVKKIGIRELMTCTINEEIASRELINEFEANVSSLDDISKEDYVTLLESVAHQSAKKIEYFNDLVTQDKALAKLEAHHIIENEKTRKSKRTQLIKDTQKEKEEEKEKNKELSKKLNLIEEELYNTKISIESSRTEIELLSSELNKQKGSIKKIIIITIITFIIVAISFILFINYSFLSLIEKVFSWILSAGGLWGLFNLIINVSKLFKIK